MPVISGTPMRVPFSHELTGIYRSLMACSGRHADKCRLEIIELRAELARRDHEIESLKQQLSKYDRSNDHP